MLRCSDWIVDKRALKPRADIRAERTWEQWLKDHPNAKEKWLMSIIDLLLRNQDWAGSYLLIQTYIAACKQGEGPGYYNQSPFDESVHVRAVRHWFWSRVEKYGFALPEEEVPYEQEDLDTRRIITVRAEDTFPFVGGKPKRRYSEAVEFFDRVYEDRELHNKACRPPDPARKKEKSTAQQRAERYAAYLAAGGKPMGWPKGKPRKPKPPV